MRILLLFGTKLLGALIGALLCGYLCMAICLEVCSLIFWDDAFTFVLSVMIYGFLAAVIGCIVGMIAGVHAVDNLRLKAASKDFSGSIKTIVAKLILIPLCVSTLLLGLSFIRKSEPSPPTGQQLKKVYLANKSDFAELVRSLRMHDKNYSDDSDPEPVLLNKLEKKLGNFKAVKDTSSDGAMFEVWGAGMAATSEDFRGFGYFQNPPKDLVVDIDHQRSKREEQFPVYQALGDNWYLYSDHRD